MNLGRRARALRVVCCVLCVVPCANALLLPSVCMGWVFERRRAGFSEVSAGVSEVSVDLRSFGRFPSETWPSPPIPSESETPGAGGVRSFGVRKFRLRSFAPAVRKFGNPSPVRSPAGACSERSFAAPEVSVSEVSASENLMDLRNFGRSVRNSGKSSLYRCELRRVKTFPRKSEILTKFSKVFAETDRDRAAHGLSRPSIKASQVPVHVLGRGKA